MTDFRLHPDIDVNGLRTGWRRNGHVRIPQFLVASDAEMLRTHLRERSDWRQVLNSGDKVFELDRATLDGLDPALRSALDDAVVAGARSGFQFRYETLRVSDGLAARASTSDLLHRFARFMSGNEVLALLRGITGATDIVFADLQATAYAPGDLLTRHDDGVEGKDRRAAYVFGLNPDWRMEWGGLLLFHEADDRVVGLGPSFNTLDLFAVPQSHSVSMVTRAARNRRYSVTGWLRAQPQPD